MAEHIETVIVGGGQAGLATSYHLTQHGHEHVVLEQAAQVANVWRNERWDSFTLVTPNWALKMPGAEYNGAAPNGFMPREEVVTYLEKYVGQFRLPVECDTRVLSIEPLDGKGYRIQTSRKTFTANNVVIATGFFQKPKIPKFAADFSKDITQLHSSAYRNPESLPDGSVLIVGSAQSGCQIAEELYQHGRKIFLCTGSAGRAPRRYRGRDVIEWLDVTGGFDLTPEQLPPGMGKFKGIPHFSGTKGGHTLNLHQFARDGVTLVGHLRVASDNGIFLTPDLRENLKSADQFEAEVVKMIDGYIEANDLDAPLEELPQLRDGYEQPEVMELDLKVHGIKTIIWAVGYTFDYSLVRLPVRDGDGFPIQTNGVTDYPGLYFSGMPWMPTERPGFLLGIGERAGYIASQIAAPVAE